MIRDSAKDFLIWRCWQRMKFGAATGDTDAHPNDHGHQQGGRATGALCAVDVEPTGTKMRTQNRIGLDAVFF
jgi:hypothetical protein